MQAEEARISGAESGNTYFQRNILKAKQRTGSVSRIMVNTKNSVKTRKSLTGNAFKPVKSGSAYAGSIAKKRVGKGTKVAVKTQKEVTKKAAKETAKQAKEFAQKTVVTAKKTAQATVRAAVKAAQLVAKAAQALISAIAALGGWAILVVSPIVISIVASIAASPFGIFISDEAADIESIPISSIINECNIELSEKLEEIENDNDHDRVELKGEPADWGLILSLFAVKVAGTDDDSAEDVVVIDEAKKQRLKDVFWDMHEIDYSTGNEMTDGVTEAVLYITIKAKTKEEMIEKYSFTRKQKEALETLLENDDSFISAAQSLAISDATAQDIIDKLPDSLSDERKQIVKKACSLVGKVTYFWGGKSSAIGWDSNWGKMTRVTAEGSRTTGTVRPFGLDCSGFVTWAFHNAGFSESQIGHGAATQSTKGTRISWASAKPGDWRCITISHTLV